MEDVPLLSDRQTAADQVFAALYDRIAALILEPGTRISETQVASEFGVSRQPVREAFNRLGAAGLLRIRPQRGTQVQKISRSGIEAARFVRLAIELEVLREASRHWTADLAPGFAAVLRDQAAAARDMDHKAFHGLDEEFHRLLTMAARQPQAFDVIRKNKAPVDRLCVLSLKNADEMATLVVDHQRILDAVSSADTKAAQAALRHHLSRLTATINAVSARHQTYFTD